MLQIPILLADVDDWIRIGFLALFILGPIIGQIKKAITGEGKPGQKPQRRPQQRRPIPQQQQPMAGGGAGQGRDALEAEIEDFLRQAGGGAKQAPKPKPRRPGQQEQRPARTRPQQRPGQPNRPITAKSVPQKKQRPKTRRALQQQPIEAEVIGDESVAEHVRRHISTKDIQEHAQSLGHEVSQTDENLESHLHDVFDHDVGSITEHLDEEIRQGTDSDVWDSSSSRTTAAELRNAAIVEMLQNPDTVKNAVILHEIFKRPDF